MLEQVEKTIIPMNLPKLIMEIQKIRTGLTQKTKKLSASLPVSFPFILEEGK